MAQCAAAPVCRHFNTEFDSRLAGAEQKTADDPAFEFARKLAADNPDPNQAFHGYKFRIGSELSVVVVLVAYPAEYGISGVMTPLSSRVALSTKKISDPRRATLAPQINGKPDGDWTLVQ